MEVETDSDSEDGSKILGGHQSRIGQKCCGYVARIQTTCSQKPKLSRHRQREPLWHQDQKVYSHPTVNSESGSPACKLPPTPLIDNVRRCEEEQGMQHLPYLARRNSLCEQTLALKPKYFPVEAGQMKRKQAKAHPLRSPQKSAPYTKIVQKLLLKYWLLSRLKDGY